MNGRWRLAALPLALGAAVLPLLSTGCTLRTDEPPRGTPAHGVTASAGTPAPTGEGPRAPAETGPRALLDPVPFRPGEAFRSAAEDLRKGRWAEGIPALERASKAKGADFETLCFAGGLAALRGKDSLAFEFFRLALEFNRRDCALRLQYAQALARAPRSLHLENESGRLWASVLTDPACGPDYKEIAARAEALDPSLPEGLGPLESGVAEFVACPEGTSPDEWIQDVALRAVAAAKRVGPPPSAPAGTGWEGVRMERAGTGFRVLGGAALFGHRLADARALLLAIPWKARPMEPKSLIHLLDEIAAPGEPVPEGAEPVSPPALFRDRSSRFELELPAGWTVNHLDEKGDSTLLIAPVQAASPADPALAGQPWLLLRVAEAPSGKGAPPLTEEDGSAIGRSLESGLPEGVTVSTREMAPWTTDDGLVKGWRHLFRYNSPDRHEEALVSCTGADARRTYYLSWQGPAAELPAAAAVFERAARTLHSVS